MKILLIILSLFLGFTTFAAPQTAQTSAIHDTDLEMRAKKRQYPGGVDEEDLKVMPTLPNATRRVDKASVERKVITTTQEAQEGEPQD